MSQTIADLVPDAVDYESTLALAIELSDKSWVLAAQVPGLAHRKAKRTVNPDAEALMAAIVGYRARAAATGRSIERVITVYEAGWPAHAKINVDDHLNRRKPNNDRWLKRHPNVHFHFTPTRASWLNQVEIWFSILAGKSLRGASFTSITQLRQHIDAFIEAYNADATPFVRTKAVINQRRFKGRRISQL